MGVSIVGPDLPALARSTGEAGERLQGMTRRTRCVRVADASWTGRAEVWLKLENEQETGSFKARGAANKLAVLGPGHLARGIVAASSGNHGAGLAWAGSLLGVVPRIIVHAGADPFKVDRLKRMGAVVEVMEGTSLEAEVFARAAAAESGSTYVSPYNDVDVICGQGTVAVELGRQLGAVDAVYASVGGGGLIGGIGAWLRRVAPSTRVIGVSPERSPVMAASVLAGRIIEMETFDTLSDATAGGIEEGSVTFPLCRRVVDDWVLVGEEEIAAEMRRFAHWFGESARIEGAAGAALAGFARHRHRHAGERVAIVICSGNVGPAIVASVYG